MLVHMRRIYIYCAVLGMLIFSMTLIFNLPGVPSYISYMFETAFCQVDFNSKVNAKDIFSAEYIGDDMNWSWKRGDDSEKLRRLLRFFESGVYTEAGEKDIPNISPDESFCCYDFAGNKCLSISVYGDVYIKDNLTKRVYMCRTQNITNRISVILGFEN